MVDVLAVDPEDPVKTQRDAFEDGMGDSGGNGDFGPLQHAVSHRHRHTDRRGAAELHQLADLMQDDERRSRAVCQHALTRLNTRYKTDTDKPFVAHNLQEFYDTYKPVFKLGLTKECLEQLFEEFAKNFKENA